jgi:tetratricopeptide (TPR) repeat protein
MFASPPAFVIVAGLRDPGSLPLNHRWHEAAGAADTVRISDMDLTTLTVAVMIALGLLGTDAVMHSGTVGVEVSIAPKIEGVSVDEATLAAEFEDQFDAITTTSSVVRPLEIRSREDQGVGLALAEAFNAQNVAHALQRQLGLNADNIRFTLYVDRGQLRGLVHGRSHLIGTINHIMIPNKDEPVIAFVQRSALWAASEIAPYSTALYLMQKHASDKDFTDAVALIDHAKALLPPTPTSMDRSLFDNLRGLIALFKNDPKSARKAFDDAMFGDPTNPVPFLNAAFTDIQLDEYQRAADRMQELVRLAPPTNKILLGTSYMIWGAALMGLHDLPGASRMLAKSVEINPQSASALGLWAEEKAVEGDQDSAHRLHHRASEASATFENYGEVAALYFHLAWKDNQPVSLNKFTNPTIVTFH